MWSFQYKHGDRPLEGYTIQRAAGRGGFGEVYYALSDSGREVALKAVQGYEQIELRGISQCMNLKSPHLVSIFDVRHNDQGRPFVIMEFVNGPSLRQLLDEAPSGLGEQKAAFFLREMAKGLTFLHDCGIVHRDLKPGNVFYENGYVKIGDYGLSKSITAGQTSQQTVTVGTVHYMAPEIGGGNYDRSIDIYALGACLYEMLTGTVPFIGASPSEILMKHLSAEPDCTGINEPFASVIKKAMHKDPTRRFQSVQEMVEAVFGADHVRNSMSIFSPDELSVVAGKVAAKLNAPVNSSSVVKAGQPVATGNAWTRLNENAAAGTATSARIDDIDAANATDPMPRRDRWILALFTAVVVALAVGLLAGHRRGLFGPFAATAFLATCGAAAGLWFGTRWSRNWGEPDKSNRFFTSGMAICGAAVLSGGLATLPGDRTFATWIAIAVPLFLIDTNAWTRPTRKERVSLGEAFKAGFGAMICSFIFQGSTPLACGIMSGVALLTQVLAPWRVNSSQGARGFEVTTKGPAIPPIPVAAPLPRAGFGRNEATAVVAPAPVVPFERMQTASSIESRRVPVAFRLVMLAIAAVALIGGLLATIAYGTGVADGPDGAPTIALGVCLLILSAFAMERARKRTMTNWWSLITKPAMLLLCVESIVFSGTLLGNLPSITPDEQMFGVFFIIFPAILFLVILAVPSVMRDDVVLATEFVRNSPSPYKRLWALLLACLGFCAVSGIHRIYVGKVGSGIVYLLTFGWFWIGTVIDIISICSGTFRDAAGRTLKQWEDEPVTDTPVQTNRTREWFEGMREQVGVARAKLGEAHVKVTYGRDRRAMKEAMRAAKYKAIAAANRPPRDLRVVTGGMMSVLASLLIFVSFVATGALALDLPGFLAAGLPQPSVAKHLAVDVFGYGEWPSLARKLGALAIGIVMLLGLTVMMFARRRAGFSHMARGVIGAAGLLFAFMPIASNVRNDDMWAEVAPMFQTREPGRASLAVDDVLEQLKRGNAPYVAGGLFIASVILIAWPERRANRSLENAPTPQARAVAIDTRGASSHAATVAVSSDESTKVTEPAKGS